MTQIPDTAAGEPALSVDLAIIGAGPVGLALAGWLAQRSSTRALTVALIDSRDAGAARVAGNPADPRAIAVSHGSRMLLEPLAWPAEVSAGQGNSGSGNSSGAIKQIHISQQGHFGRALIDHREHGLPALGYVVRYSRLVEQLAQAVKATPVRWLTHTTAQTPRQDATGATVPLRTADGSGPAQLRAGLVIHAEGGLYQAPLPAVAAHATPSPAGATQLRRRMQTRDYRQTAIVGTVRVAAPHPAVAWERFTAEGPLALLPLGGALQEWALVWCGRPAAAQARMAMSEADFLAALQSAFGTRMGRFTHISARAVFPLGLNALQQLVDGRTAAIGNAAQTLHPVAGQGLNLGLRDAYALVDALAQHGAEPAALSDFAARRAGDRHLTIAATDALARAFTADFAPLGALRGLALSALDFMPPAKTWLARQMMFGQRR
jgi:2-octaprenyl-6-methoxyphenol hydroxylase